MARRRLLVGVPVALALLAAACGSGPGAVLDVIGAGSGTDGDGQAPGAEAGGTPGEPVTVSYATFSAVPRHRTTLDRVVAAFEAAHPDVVVEVEAAPAADYYPWLEARFAAGDVPDVLETDHEHFVGLAARGRLADLGPHIADDPDFDSGAYYPRAYEAFARGQTQHGLPAAFSTSLLFFNRDLFDAAGVDHPTALWTWADERAAAAALTDAGSGTWGTYSPVGYEELYKTAAQNGCALVDADGVGIAQPPCVEALEHMLGAVFDGLQPSDDDLPAASAADLFAEGKLAMLTASTDMFDAFADAPFAWDVVLEPGNTSDAHHLHATGVALTAEGAHQEAAYRWARFLTTAPEAARIRVEAGWQLPSLADASLSAAFLSDTAPPDNRHAVLDALESAVLPPVIERQAELEDAVDAAVDRAARRQAGPWLALHQAGREIEALRGR